MRLHRAHHRHRHDHGGGDDDGLMPSPSWYDWFGRIFRGAYRRVALDVVAGVPRGASVLDVGTGPGHFVAAIARSRPDLTVTGVDVDPRMVDLAQAHLAGIEDRATVVVGDALDLPFPDDSFDVVTSTLSLHHWPDAAEGASELDRVRRPGGRIRIYDLRWSSWEDAAAALAVPGSVDELPRVRVSPLPWPTLRRLDA